MQNNINYEDELDEELTIDLKKIALTFVQRKELVLKVFVSIVILFVVLTFILPKKYTVTTDLYINKANNTNLVEVNPFIIENMNAASGGLSSLISGGGASGLTDEIELIKSQLVLDDVIRDNDLKVPDKKFGIFKNKRAGEYISAAGFIGKGKNPVIENKKGTNIITITYKSKKPQVAYDIVKSITKNYIDLHKEIHSDRAKSDIDVLQEEYVKEKAKLERKISERKGLSDRMSASASQVSLLSAFSKSARSAVSSLNAQVAQGQKSEMEISETAKKVEMLASKLEWLKLVDKYSDTTKVMVIKEPILPLANENSSPKLIINLLLGIVFGFIASIIAIVYAENTDKKLSYSMLGDNILYDKSDLPLFLLTNKNKKITAVFFDSIPTVVESQLREFSNIQITKAEISNNFIDKINYTESVILFPSVAKTDAKLYKNTIGMIKELDKTIIKEVLV